MKSARVAVYWRGNTGGMWHGILLHNTLFAELLDGHCLHLWLKFQIQINDVVGKHNFWDARDKFYELYDPLPALDEVPVVMASAFGLESHSCSCISCSTLTSPLVTLTRWIKLLVCGWFFLWFYFFFLLNLLLSLCLSTCKETRKQIFSGKAGEYCSQLS